jgi:hypothetical protein
LVQLTEQDSFNLFEIAPKEPMDLYQERLAGGSIKIGVTSVMDEMVPQEIQTEEPVMADKFNQYPDDQYHNYRDEGK